MANHTEKEWWWKGEKFKAEPGQFITSIKGIQEKAGRGISGQNIRSALKRFESLGFLTDEPTKTGRLITIVNWGVYQGTEGEANKVSSKEVTKSQHRTNKEVTPNNNDNNDNKKTLSDNSVEMVLANELKEYILENNPKARVPVNLDRWAHVFDLMMRRDKRTVDDIRRVMEFSQRDDFWKSNILSPSSLRKQFDRLYLRITSRKQASYQAPYHKVKGGRV